MSDDTLLNVSYYDAEDVVELLVDAVSSTHPKMQFKLLFRGDMTVSTALRPKEAEVTEILLFRFEISNLQQI